MSFFTTCSFKAIAKTRLSNYWFSLQAGRLVSWFNFTLMIYTLPIDGYWNVKKFNIQ